MAERIDQQPNNMQGKTPDQIRQEAKERVAKGLAAASGAMEGYVQQSDPKVVGDATRKVAETVRKTTETVREEVKQGLPGEPVFKKKGSEGPQEFVVEGESTTIASPYGTLTTGTASIHPVGEEPGVRERLGERASEVGDRLREGASQLGERAGETGQKLRERTRQVATDLKDRTRANLEMSKQYMREHSAEEIREETRNAVGRRVASVTGTLEGVKEQVDPDLPSEAVHKTAEAVREAGSAIREEVKKGRQEMGGGSSNL